MAICSQRSFYYLLFYFPYSGMEWECVFVCGGGGGGGGVRMCVFKGRGGKMGGVAKGVSEEVKEVGVGRGG